jgi:hypothetical protein
MRISFGLLLCAVALISIQSTAFGQIAYSISDNTLHINGSTSGFIAVPFGLPGDQPLPGAYSVP